ncbi:hypothetical protein ZWY2020_049741 [Hordeum vulgare]|nr:hypothetical protein ZWY2020_049741 [Hordeum vulgare]
MAGAIAYEEQRRRQVEENKRKLEELKLHHLSAAVREAATPKPSPAKSVKRKRVPREDGEDAPVRRSGRVASLPEQPKYRFEDVFHVLEKKIRRGSRKTTSTRSDLINRVYATDVAREYAIAKAEELQAKLESASFVRPMTQSHVTGGFWLSLPMPFCRKHLPKRDERLILEDEQGVESETLYLAPKNGLSAGWRGFAIQHDLVDGDCLVFELIDRTKFKVYIIRQSSYYER